MPTQPIQTNAELISICEKIDAKVPQLSDMQETGEIMTAEPEQMKEDPQRDIDLTDSFNATVSFISNIDEFYILRESNNSKFESILIDCQEPGPALASVDVGAMCLASKDDIWMRARIEKISRDKAQAKIFFVDDGWRATKKISDLRVLSCHKETEDLVERVGLFGVEPLDDEKSKKDCSQIFKTFVEGERTLIVTRTDINQLVKVESPDGRDVSESLLELEIVRPVLLGAGSCCDSVFRQNFVSSYLLEV